MAYRKPAVTVIQEFVGLVPALAAFTLPAIAIGASYQLVNNDLLGTYNGSQQDYPYASMIPGAQVDLAELDPKELFPATKKPISVKLKKAEVEVKPSGQIGSGNALNLSDATVGRFVGAQAGDLVVITPSLNVAVVAPLADGISTDAVGQRNRLSPAAAGQFLQVKTGDSVVVTGGTNTVTGTYLVLAKVSNDLLLLDADINTGGGPSSDVAYSISGDRGQQNSGNYRIKLVTSDNDVTLESPLAEEEHLFSYFVKRELAEISLSRAALPANAFEADADKIRITSGLLHNSLPVLSGMVYANYRALRNDMSNNVREFARLSDLQSFFGVDQISPANPLAYGLSTMLQNTTTPVNGLGLNDEGASNESSSFQNALDVVAMTEMYALVPLTQNPVIHQQIKAHVEGLSQPDNKKERVGIVNRLLKKEEIVKDESLTSSLTANSRIIANTQIDGSAMFAQSNWLNDASPDAFLNVQLGDTVVIVGGTNVIAGEYSVDSKNSNNQIVLDAAVVSANSSDIQYYIIRKDGIGANGITFYDRNATFITDGVSPGYSIRIPSGPLAGSYKISSVQSEKQVSLAQIPGVVSLQTGITYEIFRDLSKTEQADFVKNYSSSVGSRRVVNVWPDIVKAPVGAVIENLPGFYAACAVGAMTTGLPTQQGFTNLTIVGFLGLENSTGYFTDAQMDIMADGGTFIFGQEGEDSPLFVRHQLTTDRSAIKFQEYSFTKNCDYVAKFLRDAFKGYIGVYNIVDSTMDELKGTAKAVLTFLKDDTRLPRIGGVIRSGQLVTLEESETQIDTIIMRFELSLPIPLNNLVITIEV